MCHYSLYAILTYQSVAADRITAKFGRLLLPAKQTQGSKESLRCIVSGHNPE